MKNKLKSEIQQIITSGNEINVQDNFFQNVTNLLQQYDCSFRFLRKDSKRNGHVKIKKINGIYYRELAINKKDNDAGKMYTIIHELTHLVNNHVHSKNLTSKQKEVVADSTALYFIYCCGLLTQYKNSNVATKWDVLNYSNAYIDSMQISEKRSKVIIDEIRNSITYFTDVLF